MFDLVTCSHYEIHIIFPWSNTQIQIPELKIPPKYLDCLYILSNLLNPLSNQDFIYSKCIYAFHGRFIFSIALQTILSWKHTLWTLIRLLPSANWSGSILSHSEWWNKRQRLKTTIEMKQTADDSQYIPVWKLLTHHKATARSSCQRLGVTAGWPFDIRTILGALLGHRAETLRALYDYRKSLRSFLGQKWQLKIARCPHDHLEVPVRGSYNVTAMCLRATGLRFFQICHCAELNKIVEATMPVNPYDGRKVSLRRPHGNGDLDIVRASYTRRKANVTEA